MRSDPRSLRQRAGDRVRAVDPLHTSNIERRRKRTRVAVHVQPAFRVGSGAAGQTRQRVFIRRLPAIRIASAGLDTRLTLDVDRDPQISATAGVETKARRAWPDDRNGVLSTASRRYGPAARTVRPHSAPRLRGFAPVVNSGPH